MPDHITSGIFRPLDKSLLRHGAQQPLCDARRIAEMARDLAHPDRLPPLGKIAENLKRTLNRLVPLPGFRFLSCHTVRPSGKAMSAIIGIASRHLQRKPVLPLPLWRADPMRAS